MSIQNFDYLSGLATTEVNQQKRERSSLAESTNFSLKPISRISTLSTPAYSWDVNFVSNINSSPILDPIGTLGTNATATVFGQANKSVYKFGAQSGLLINNPVVPANNYSIELVFSVDLTTGFRKIIDFSDRTADDGLYVLNNSLRFFGTSSAGGTLLTGYNHLILTRASNKTTTAYLNGTQVFSFSDTTGLADLSPNKDLALFVDDNGTGGREQSPGAVDFVGLYSNVLTPTEVSARANFFRNTNSEVTNTISLSLSSAGGISENSTSNFVYTFTRVGSTSSSLTVNFGVSGTAIFGSDYTLVGTNASLTGTNGSITFAAGASTATLALDPVANSVVEPSETINLTLTNSGNYGVGTPNAVVATIINDDGTRSQVGTSGKDILLGTARADILNGGPGNDTLTGGANADTFAFSSPAQGIDTITDFVPGEDVILVSGSGFINAGLSAGNTITPAQLVIGSAATNMAQRFIYNSSSGALSFDRDGSGSAAAVGFAILKTGLSLTNEDILVG
ncbi:MAG: hypothetical protein N5P05_001255 [Chroococcopsis gigantea SAG 12.99]|jgi:Ca2+-binding RTX toxin-like protein|nr:hypothetical protein [Chlorogloea purpurea SAG 13.99]MDV2999649.1 hypothetical protein [Chroococcopsis gigantea SAG 12.99]